MATVNRYSQIQQPLLIDPLSVEELSLVPMAKARADAAGVGAVSNINTDYNVDAKDLNTVSGLIKDIDGEKDRLIEQISSQGVTNETISDVLKLRKSREQIYKTVVQKAEENKAKIERWNDVVDQMAVKYGTDYADAVRSKGYDNWQGTMQGTTPTDFKEEYGPKYINVESDILQTFKAAGIKSMSGASKVKIEKDPFTGKIKVTDPTRTVKSTNIEGLQAAIDMLQAEYSNPETERGKFAKFTGLSQSALLDKLKEYKDISLLEDVRTTGGGTRLYKDDSSNTPQEPFTVSNLPGVKVKLPSESRGGSNQFIDNVSAGVEAINVKEASKDMENTTTVLPTGADLSRHLTKQFLAGFTKNEARNINMEQVKQIATWKYTGILAQLLDEGGITKEIYDKAFKAKDPKAIEQIYNAGHKYTNDKSVVVFPTVHTDIYDEAYEGLRTKNYPEKAMNDLRTKVEAGILSVFDYNTGKKVTGDVAKKAVNKETGSKIVGALPLGSRVALNNPKKHKGDIITTPEGTKYIVQALPTVSGTQEFKNGQRLEKFLSGIAPGSFSHAELNFPDQKPRTVQIIGGFEGEELGKFVIRFGNGEERLLDGTYISYIKPPKNFN